VAGPTPKLVLVLSENWTLVSPRDLRTLVRIAVEAEDAGIDGVMVSEHVALGPSARAGGLPSNPREYALPGNQDPATPWPSSVVVLAAISAATERIRPIAAAVIAPLRHPLLVAKDMATLDLLSDGRLVVQPTVGWHRDEYEALGVQFERRGDLLDEHLEAWRAVWRGSPASFRGERYAFADVWLEPKPVRPDGPTIWLGGSTLHPRLLRRIVRYASGFHPLGSPADAELLALRTAMASAGRDVRELEMVGGIRGTFPDPAGPADLALAMESIPAQVERGFTAICFKPSQFVDEVSEIGPLCREIVRRLGEMTA
jgi:probable F420-dependent oxidoreductase